MRKTLAWILLALLAAAAVSAFASGLSVTLDAALPVAEQAGALAGYVAQLPRARQEEWREHFALLALGASVNFAQAAGDADAQMVYISDSGARFHRSLGCLGLRSAATISAVTREVAEAMGRTPCRVCWK